MLLAPLELAHSGEDGNRSKYMTNVVFKDQCTHHSVCLIIDWSCSQGYANAVIHCFTGADGMQTMVESLLHKLATDLGSVKFHSLPSPPF